MSSVVHAGGVGRVRQLWRSAFERLLGWAARLDPAGARRVRNLLALLVAGVAVLEAARVRWAPLTTTWEYIKSDPAKITLVFAYFVLWSGVLVSVYRNQPQDSKHKANILHKLTPVLEHRFLMPLALMLVALSGIAWVGTPNAIDLGRMGGDPGISGFSCNSELPFDRRTGHVRRTIAQGGLLGRGADECGAFAQPNFEQLTVFQGSAGDRLTIMLALQDADCAAKPPTPSGTRIYFADVAIQTTHWNLPSPRFLGRDCITLNAMTDVVPATTRVRFALAYDCTAFGPDAAPTVPVKVRVSNGTNQQSRTYTINLSDVHRRFYAEACARDPGAN